MEVHVQKVRLEKVIEQAFLKKMKKAHPKIRCPKFSAIGWRSWPDRVIFLPGGKVILIEFKRKGEGPTPGQKECHDYLRSIGHLVLVTYDENEALEFVGRYLERIRGLK